MASQQRSQQHNQHLGCSKPWASELEPSSEAGTQVELSTVGDSKVQAQTISEGGSSDGPSTARSTSTSLPHLDSRRWTRSGSLRHTSAEAAYSGVQQLVLDLVSAAGGEQQQQCQDTLLERVRELCQAAEGFACKSRENENLTQVLRELSETRAEAIRVKVLTLESYHKLQDEYSRVLKASQLAHQVSRTNFGKAHRLRSELADARQELHKAHKQIASLQARNSGLRGDNEALRRDVASLERLQLLGDCRTSMCMQHFTSARPMSLY